MPPAGILQDASLSCHQMFTIAASHSFTLFRSHQLHLSLPSNMFFLLVIPQAFTAIGLFCCTTARLAVCMAVLMFMVITSSFSIASPDGVIFCSLYGHQCTQQIDHIQAFGTVTVLVCVCIQVCTGICRRACAAMQSLWPSMAALRRRARSSLHASRSCYATTAAC